MRLFSQSTLRFCLSLALAAAWADSAEAKRSSSDEPKIIRPSETKYRKSNLIQTDLLSEKESRLARKQAKARLKAEKRELKQLARSLAKEKGSALEEVSVMAPSSNPVSKGRLPAPDAVARDPKRESPRNAAEDASVYRVYDGSPNQVTVERAEKAAKGKE